MNTNTTGQITLLREEVGRHKILVATPYQADFHGIQVTIGKGIQRAFSEFLIDPDFAPPATQYVKKIFDYEMNFIFEIDESCKTEFLKDLSEFHSLYLYLLHIKEHPIYASDAHAKFACLDESLKERLNKVSLLTEENLTHEQKYELFSLVYNATLKFIDALLIETNQINDIDTEGIKSKIISDFSQPKNAGASTEAARPNSLAESNDNLPYESGPGVNSAPVRAQQADNSFPHRNLLIFFIIFLAVLIKLS